MLYQTFKEKKTQLNAKTKASVVDRYGSVGQAAPDEELLLGQTERCGLIPDVPHPCDGLRTLQQQRFGVLYQKHQKVYILLYWKHQNLFVLLHGKSLQPSRI